MTHRRSAGFSLHYGDVSLCAVIGICPQSNPAVAALVLLGNGPSLVKTNLC